jgi:hypothetical protein
LAAFYLSQTPYYRLVPYNDGPIGLELQVRAAQFGKPGIGPGGIGHPYVSATASLPIVNLDILKNWILLHIERLWYLCEAQICMPNWISKSLLDNPAEMLKLKRQACPGFVEAQDPDVEKLGPEFYKKYANKNGLPLILEVDAVFLATASPEEVTQRVRQHIKVGGRNGRFAIYLCNLGATTPTVNVRAAVAAVRQYGVYDAGRSPNELKQ